jgi:hypothetical protein
LASRPFWRFRRYYRLAVKILGWVMEFWILDFGLYLHQVE